MIRQIFEEEDEQVKANLFARVTNILSVTKSEVTKVTKLKVFLGEILDKNYDE